MKIFGYSISKILQLVFLILSVLVILFAGLKIHWGLSLIIGIIPLIIASSLFIASSPYWIFISLFIFNYFIMGLTRYLPGLKGGVTMDLLILFIIASLIINKINPKTKYNWNRVNNPMTYSILIWVIYCFLELFNPQSVSSQAWFTGARGMSLYFIIIFILSTLIINDYKKLKAILFIWSILTIIAFIKVYIQKNYGFDVAEKRWLYVDGGARTHIIYSGIRYFSFFNDAATFGCSMAFSFVVFIISAFGKINLKYKIYYIIVSLIALYSMFQSGTRVALVIPFIGIATYLVLSKRIRTVLIFGGILVFMFVFFKYTNIGQGNSNIRRARTAFNPSKDASYLVRLENQNKMKTYMVDKPFGIGIGLSAGRAQRYGSYTKLSELPTDSWFVLVWIETGIIGLSLYIGVLLFILAYSAYIIMFKLKNKELRQYMMGLFGGIAGMMVAAYANEAFTQFPNGFIVYIGLAMISISPYFDKEIEEKEQKEKEIVEGSKQFTAL